VPAPNKQLQRTVIRRRGRAERARHFIMHVRRASHGSTRPLNCGVMRHRRHPRLCQPSEISERRRRAQS
jgi:hypothetical protein